jgi:hypothetical protein
MRPSGAHTHPDGGGGLVAIAAVVIIGGILARPVMHAVDELLHAVLIVAAVLAGLAVAAALTGLVLVLRRQRGRQHLDAPEWVTERCDAPRIPSQGPIPVRPSPAGLTRQVPEIDAPHAQLHLHVHYHAAPAAITKGQDNVQE